MPGRGYTAFDVKARHTATIEGFLPGVSFVGREYIWFAFQRPSSSRCNAASASWRPFIPPGKPTSVNSGVASEGLIPRPEGQVGSQDGRALLVALGDDLEEQVGLLARQGQAADLVDDQELVDADGAVQRLLPAAPLALPGLERHHQIGRGGEAHLVAVLRRQIAERDRQMRLADAAGTEEDDVLGTLAKGQPGELMDLRPRHTGGKAGDALSQSAACMGECLVPLSVNLMLSLSAGKYVDEVQP